MRAIFIGGFYPNRFLEEHTHAQITGFQSAAQNYQSAFITGLSALYGSVHLISLPFIGAFKGKTGLFKVKDQVFQENGNDVNVIGFLNFPGLKNAIRFVKLTIFLLRHFSSGKYLIYIYSTGPVFLLATLILKIVNPKVKVCTIVTDLFDYNNTFVKQLISKCYFYGYVRPLANSSDSFVYLAEKMKEYFNQRPYTVIEGIFNDMVIESLSFQFNFHIDFSQKIVLYSGTLDEQFGIKVLVHAFLSIFNVDAVLVICGVGDTHNFLTEISAGTEKVRYLGALSIESTRVLQSKSYLLVNPRPNIGEYVGLSFPSKTMEYLASGTPSLLHRLDSFPPEYDSHYYQFIGRSEEEVKKSLEYVLSLQQEELIQKAHKAKEFILKEKSPLPSVSKALQLNKIFFN